MRVRETVVSVIKLLKREKSINRRTSNSVVTICIITIIHCFPPIHFLKRMHADINTHTRTRTHTHTQLPFICRDPATDGDTVWTLTHRFLTFFTGVSYSPTRTSARLLRPSLLPCQQVAVTEGVWAESRPRVQAAIVLSRYSNSLFHSPARVRLPDSTLGLCVGAASAYFCLFMMGPVEASPLLNVKGMLIKRCSTPARCWNEGLKVYLWVTMVLCAAMQWALPILCR